ncbi:penicillin-binding protein 2 [Novosphingobium sp. MW5]|nr:penicillin-binding protein 2 [Novosphingobium sp. MW5]
MFKRFRERFSQRTQKHITSGQLANSFDRRAMVIGGLQAGVGVLLATRMTWIAIAENEHFKTLAESNRVNLSLIPPRRGLILDRHNQTLAANQQYYRVDLIPERVPDLNATLGQLGQILSLTPEKLQDLKDKIEESQGFQPVEVSAKMERSQFDAINVRLPELPGVLPQRGFTRLYPTGPSVAHLIGYVGPATAEEYKKDRDPLLITPGYKVGKDGLEKQFEQTLRGVPGARRTEVTASGRVVRDLEMRDDVQGNPIKLTIDGGLQDFASRRIGLESAAVTVIDCDTGEILALCSMPAFDPNSFIGGIGRVEWKMLNEDDHIPLLNKALRGLYPPGSTMKPMATLALQLHGVDPAERVGCPGGYRLGSRFFRCDAVHGSVDMRQAIEHSCNTYFWSMAHRVGYDAIAPVAKMLGLGQKFDLPVSSQRYGTIPDAEWKMRRYKQEWSAADSLNASIGQGYVSVSPLQLAVMTARIASGNNVQPSLIHGQKLQLGPALPFTPEQLAVAHDGMFNVVNGSGTGVGSKLPFDNIQMAGKTGTAQVRALVARGHVGDWKSRDHSLFVAYAPADKPKYAISVVVEHGTFGARAAAPIAKDVFTYLFDPGKAWATLLEMEKGWGGTPSERMAAKYRAYSAAYGTSAAKVGGDRAVEEAKAKAEKEATPSDKIVNDVIIPRSETDAAKAKQPPAPAPSPAAETPAEPQQ